MEKLFDELELRAARALALFAECEPGMDPRAAQAMRQALERWSAMSERVRRKCEEEQTRWANLPRSPAALD